MAEVRPGPALCGAGSWITNSRITRSSRYRRPRRASFRAWLRAKYGTIDKLNEDWGTASGADVYDFDQIEIPNPTRTRGGPNPHAKLDLRACSRREGAGYLRIQAAVLRQIAEAVDHDEFHDECTTGQSRAARKRIWTCSPGRIYPVHGGLFVRTELAFRLGSVRRRFLCTILCGTGNGVSGIMELQPGQVNWAPVNPWPQPGAIHVDHAGLRAGARLVCAYRYRQPLVGNEQYHKGHGGDRRRDALRRAGASLSRRCKDVGGCARSTGRKQRRPRHTKAADGISRSDIESRWDIDNHKQTTRWDTSRTG